MMCLRRVYGFDDTKVVARSMGAVNLVEYLFCLAILLAIDSRPKDLRRESKDPLIWWC